MDFLWKEIAKHCCSHVIFWRVFLSNVSVSRNHTIQKTNDLAQKDNFILIILKLWAERWNTSFLPNFISFCNGASRQVKCVDIFTSLCQIIIEICHCPVCFFLRKGVGEGALLVKKILFLLLGNALFVIFLLVMLLCSYS